MTVTIEVSNEAGGVGCTKRGVFRSEDYRDSDALTAAALAFIQEAKRANEAALESAPA